MNDDNKGAVAFQQGAPAGQAGEPGAASQAEPNAQQPGGAKFVTFEEAQRMATEAAERALRQAQSMTDKSESRIKREITDRMAKIAEATDLLKAAGVEITPEVTERVRQAVVMESLTKGSDPGQPSAPATPSQAAPNAGSEPNPDEITAQAHRMMSQAGVWIEQGDPEVAQLSQDSPYAFLHSVELAINAKKARMTARQQAAGPAPGARTPTNAGPSGPAPGLMAQYQKEVQQSNLTTDQRLQIRQKYRRLGLNI